VIVGLDLECSMRDAVTFDETAASVVEHGDHEGCDSVTW